MPPPNLHPIGCSVSPIDIKARMRVESATRIAEDTRPTAKARETRIRNLLKLAIVILGISRDQIERMRLRSLVYTTIKSGWFHRSNRRELTFKNTQIHIKIVDCASHLRITRIRQKLSLLSRVRASTVHQPDHGLFISIWMRTVIGLVQDPFYAGCCEEANISTAIRWIYPNRIENGWIFIRRLLSESYVKRNQDGHPTSHWRPLSPTDLPYHKLLSTLSLQLRATSITLD